MKKTVGLIALLSILSSLSMAQDLKISVNGLSSQVYDQDMMCDKHEHPHDHEDESGSEP